MHEMEQQNEYLVESYYHVYSVLEKERVECRKMKEKYVRLVDRLAYALAIETGVLTLAMYFIIFGG